MSKTEIKNARIRGTMLGIEDHGMMTYVLYLNYGDGGAQGAGTYGLTCREGFGVEYLRKILETVGVNEWEQLPGKHIRVEADRCKVHRIGHIIEEKWMDLSEAVGAKQTVDTGRRWE